MPKVHKALFKRPMNLLGRGKIKICPKKSCDRNASSIFSARFKNKGHLKPNIEECLFLLAFTTLGFMPMSFFSIANDGKKFLQGDENFHKPDILTS